MKYFLLGAFSSAFFLFGIAMAYGATGSTRLPAIADALAGRTGSASRSRSTAMGLLVVGFAFKVSAVPFHMWTPDVYQGAPTAVTAFMSAGTKVAAFAALMRVFNVALQPLTLGLAADRLGPGGGLDRGGERARDRADRHQADARVLEHRARGVRPDWDLSAAGENGISAALFYLVRLRARR